MMKYAKVIQSLMSWHYLASDRIPARSDIKSAVARFKHRWGDKYGLTGDDHLDDGVIALMERRFCNCSDAQEIGEGLRRWSTNTIGWHGDVRIGSLSWSDAQSFVVRQVSSACNMRIAPNDGNRNLVSSAARIDGPFGVLGQAYLPGFPSDATESLVSQFDIAETQLSENGFRILVLHEICHSLGLSHETTNATAVMDPFLDASLTGLVELDIRQLVARYGDPRASPSPPTPSPPSPPGPNPRRCRRQLRALIQAARLMEESFALPGEE